MLGHWSTQQLVNVVNTTILTHKLVYKTLMLEHLNDIEAELIFERPVKETDLDAVFQAIRKPL